MKKGFSYVIAIVMGLVSTSSDAQIVINELMQSNIDCIMDDMNEFPDSWVELYNKGDKSVNLNNYKIGVTDDSDKAWKLPNKSIGSHAYILIYCDKESSGLHTDFKLESGNGGQVYLFQGSTVADKLMEIPKQPAPNIAYGRKTDSSEEWGHQYTATPGKSNCGVLCENLLGDPIFSIKGMATTSKQPINLELSVPEGTPAGTVIKMTFDGGEPTMSSQSYNAPISITSTQTIRARLFCDGYLSPRSVTHSYLFLDRDITLPVISIVTDGTYFYDNKLGIYVDGNYNAEKKNYSYDWRRPINMEFFAEPECESQINQLCETRVQGGATRSAKLKSLIVYAHKRFGKKRLKYEFFPDQRPGIDDFKSIILRNAGNDFDYLYMRDAIIQRSMAEHADLDWQAWRPAIFFINGVYKGMLNIRERSTADNIYTNYGGLEDIDMIENWWDLKEGDKQHWEAFKTFYGEHDHTLEEFAQWMDWEEFINLMLMNLYFNNQDFPGNNIVMWRPRTEGGRWRFVAKDTDFGLGLYGSKADFNSIAWLYDPNYDSPNNWANQYDHTRLFRRLMDDQDFKREFLDRAAIYMGDFLNENGVRDIWDPMYEQIRTEYPHHRKLINQWWPNYADELSTAQEWLAKRTNYFYNHLASYYNLGTPVSTEINKNASAEDLDGAEFFINNIKLSRGRFDGKLFEGRTMTITGASIEGKHVTGWKTQIVSNEGGVTTEETEGASLSLTIPSCAKISIEAIFDVEDGIYAIEQQHPSWIKEGNHLIFHSIAKGTHVEVYDLGGHLLFRGEGNGQQMVVPLSPNSIHFIRVGDHSFKLQ